MFELDNSSFYNNQRPCPYLDLSDNSVKYRDPGFFLFEYSKGFHFLFNRVLIMDWKYQLGFLDTLNSFIDLELDEKIRFQRVGIEVLNRLVSRSKEDFPDTVLIGFSVNKGFEKDFEKVFLDNNVLFLGQFYKEIDNVEGTNCKPLDDHWNHKGHQVAGTVMYNFFKRYGLIN